MAEYIDREAFTGLFWGEQNLYSWEEIEEFMDTIPAADVQPVKHGKWMFTDAFPHHVYCSACHKTYIPNNKWQVWVCGDLPRDYCPNCGAKMEEKNVRKSNKG